MTDQIEKLGQIYYQLLNYLTGGSNSLAVLNAVRVEMGEKCQQTDDIFLFTLLNSCFNNSILVMANVIKGNKDSVDYSYLFREIRASESNFESEMFARFVKFADEFEWVLTSSEMSPIFNHILELRDKTIAHVDRKHINNPSYFLEKPPIKWDDLNSAYHVVGNGILEIGKYLNLYQELGDIVVIANFVLGKKTQKIVKFSRQLNLSSEITPSAFTE